MAGQTNLDDLLAGMTPRLAPEVFVFATLSKASPDAASIPAKMRFWEAEGETLILERTQAEAHGLAFEFPCRCITLEIHSALDAVGFLARITTHLAKLGMGVNPVSAFYHDHLFVPEDRAEEALAALQDLARAAQTSEPD
ncbi:MAG: ACT domain-containing protein [Pseudomonadota bacterium]